VRWLDIELDGVVSGLGLRLHLFVAMARVVRAFSLHRHCTAATGFHLPAFFFWELQKEFAGVNRIVVLLVLAANMQVLIRLCVHSMPSVFSEHFKVLPT